MYKPPFSITNQILNRCISITKKVGEIPSYNSLKRMPILRRNNRIKSIHSSLEIEANSLSLNDVKAVIDGKEVIGPKLEIEEVKDAYEAYNKIKSFNPYKEEDLLLARSILARSIDEKPDIYRSHQEGVINEKGKVIHLAPPPNLVPSLMKELFEWLKKDNDTNLH